MRTLLQIKPSSEKDRILSFIKNVLRKQGFKNVVIGLSGGIDSATAFYLLKEILAPENIFVAHLYYQKSLLNGLTPILKEAKIPKSNIYELCIDTIVEAFKKTLSSPRHSGEEERRLQNLPASFMTQRDSGRAHSSLARMTDKVRLGNIMARIRMIILYDLAKKHNAMVCGTENKSEFLLGYFTRFGDEASDFEPIQHLYKTQVYQLANFLGVPKNITKKTPTADLWPGQTDEKEYGFTYKEADQVLFYYYDKKLKIEEIRKKGFGNADKIIAYSIKNSYKHHVPYAIKIK